MDSVVKIAAQEAKSRGVNNILSKIRGRYFGLEISNNVPNEKTQMPGLTTTLFLNKNWSIENDGGELRLNPTKYTSAKIPPLFDRVVFYPQHITNPKIFTTSKINKYCTITYL